MKKILSLVLIAVLVLGMVPFSFAADMTAGEQLKAYGIIDGYEDGTLREENALTRAQMMKILVDLFAAEDEVAVYPLDAPFTDIEGHWAQDVIDYAVGSGWTNGKTATTFAPDAPVTDAQLATFLMRALGYEPTDWTMAVAEIAEMGVTVTATTSATRGDAFASILSSLDVMPKDKEMTLGSQLELPGYEAPYVAPETLEVVSVTAINMKQIEVVYNKAIDAAGDEDNYELSDEDTTAVLDADSDFELLEDGMTVVITLTDAADQQDVETLTIDGIEDEDENALDEADFEIEFLDTTLPTVLSAEVVGNDTIKVTFSEPMDSTTDDAGEFGEVGFEVDGGDYNIKEVIAVNNDTEANIVLYADLDEGDVTVKVTTDTEDYAGFGATPTTLTVSVEEDETAPVIVGYSDASKTGVTIIWSEDIEIADYSADNFYHTNDNNPVDANLVDADVDGTEMTLDFTDNELPEGTAYIYVAADAVNDLWDNENDKEQFVIEVEIDETAPMVDDVDYVDETTLDIDFDEEIDEDSVEEDAFTLYQDGDEVEDIIAGVELSADMLTVTITFDEDLSGDYTIAIEDLEDLAGNEIAEVEEEFTADDTTNPDADDFTAVVYNGGDDEEQMIKVDFDEEMMVEGDYSILDVDKYTIVIDGTSYDLADMDEDFVDFDAVDDNTAVEIMIPTTTDDDEYGVDIDVTNDAVSLIVGKVADAAGNTTSGVSFTLAESDIDTTTTDGLGRLDEEGTITLTSADIVATDVDTVEVSFGDILDDFEDGNFVIYAEVSANGAYDANTDVELNFGKVSLDEDSDGNTVAVFTLSEDDELNYDGSFDDDGTDRVVKVEITTSADTVNMYGEQVDSADLEVLDEIAPEVDTIVYVSEDIIQVYFTEDLDGDYFATSLAAVNGFSVTGGTLASALQDDNLDNLVILTSDDSDFTKNTNVSYDDSFGLVDLAVDESGDPAGVALADFSETDVLDLATVTLTEADPTDETVTITVNFEEGFSADGPTSIKDETATVVGEYTITLTLDEDTTLEVDDTITAELDVNGVLTIAVTDGSTDDDSADGTHTLKVMNTLSGAYDTVTLTITADAPVITE